MKVLSQRRGERPRLRPVRAGLPPGPRVSVLQAWSFLHRPSPHQVSLRERYGPVVTLQTVEAKLVLALTAEGARQVLTADPDGYDAFQKRAFLSLIGNGSLWVLEGEQHRRERRLVQPPFHATRVRGYGQAIKGLARHYSDSWQPGQEFRAYDAMLDISRDLVLRVVLGLEHGPALQQGRRILSRMLDASTPWVSLVWLVHRWWFPPWRQYQRAKREFSQFVADQLAERRAADTESDDVLGLMMAARHDDGSPIPDDEIRDELITILLAGHETTAVALSWAIYEVWRHPAVLARLREELDVLEPDPEPDAVVKQPYLSAVCDETLRLHTILTEVARIARTPRELLGYTVPAGTGVGVGVCAVHHDPEVYPEPDLFRPERFLERTYSPFEFLPFGGGDRRCLGAALSDYEMRVVLATVVTRWDLHPIGEDRDVRHNIGSGPEHGVRVSVRERRRGGGGG